MSLKDHGNTLLNKGYPIIPIRNGYKFPRGLDDWQHTVADKSKLKKWLANGFADGGVGVLAKTCPAVDIDVHDEDVVNQVVDYCEKLIGTTVQRVGMKPKTLLVYRTDEPFTKVMSRTFVDWLDNEHRLEILGDGQQFVAYAVHPDTNKPYEWVSSEGLVDIKYDDLPTMTVEDARKLVEYFESIVPDDWEVKKGSKSANGKTMSGVAMEDRAMMNVKPKVNVSTTRLEKSLMSIKDADEYETWVQIGMALYHQYDGSNEGYELWCKWSEQSEKYDVDANEKRWSSFEADLRHHEPVTAATILKLGRVSKEKEIGDPVEAFNKRYVYIEQGNRVADLTKPPHYSVSKLEEFRNRTANTRTEIPVPTKSEPKKTKMVPVSMLWMVNADREAAEGCTYMPKQGRVVTDDLGHTWVNEFHMPEFRDVNISKVGDELKVFKKHMKYLFPIKEEREWFVSWIAFNLQHPEKRCMVTPLHVSPAHGTGRGWLVKLLGKLVGQWNITKTKMDVLSGDGNGAGFHEYLNHSLICAVEEVREGKKRYGVSDAIRDVLTEDYLEINLKFGTKQTQQVFTNFFFMSNHPDALVLTEDDRRINVFLGPSKEKGLAYYDRLYSWLESDGVAALFSWLMKRNLDGFNWKRSMHNEARQTMIENNRTETEVLFWQMMKSPPYFAMTIGQIESYMLSISEKDEFETNIEEGQLLKLLQQYCRHYKQIKIDGRKPRPWVLKEIANINNEKVRNSVKKAEKGHSGSH